MQDVLRLGRAWSDARPIHRYLARPPDAFLAGWVSRPEPDRFWLRFGYLERVL
jgi:hypothetical protein